MPINEQLKSVITTATLVASYGIGLGLLWFLLGPVLALNPATLIVLSALLLATWPLAVLINWMLQRRNGAAQPAAVNNQAQVARPAAQSAVSASRRYPALETSAAEAAQWLRANWRGPTPQGDALYGLPWLLVVGPPHSGKTSLLLTAGLDFNALPSQMRADQMEVRPTRNCDWRVTNDAVLLDTAGRYMSEGQADRDEWLGLIETLKQSRPDRPFDGLLVVVSAAQLSRCDEREIERQARVIRDRIDEARNIAQLRFPVYVVFTHTDGLEGFTDFFRTLSPGERSQVWGATIRLDKAPQAHALFDGYCDELYARLSRQRLFRMSRPEITTAKSVTRLLSPEQLRTMYSEQLRIFNFPFRFGGMRRNLSLFTSALFRPNPFSVNLLFRGFYLTSSLPAIAGRAVPAGAPGATGELKPAGRGWFTEVLFKDVLQRDRQLAAAFQPPSQYPKLLRRVLLGLAALTLFVLLTGMLVSYFRNRALIAEGEQLGAEVTRTVRVTKKNEPATPEEVAALNHLREFLQKYETAPDLFYRFGLYSGPAISAPLRAIYFDAISQRFFIPAAEAMEKDLRAFTDRQDQPQEKDVDDYYGRYYDLLKAYLMFARPERADQPTLENTLAEYWSKNAPAADTEGNWRELLKYYASQAASSDAPHWKADDALVDKTRTRLRNSYPLENRFYKIIVGRSNQAARAITLETMLGQQSDTLKGSYVVPGSYTLDGYYDHIRPAINSASTEVREEDWVVGLNAGDNQKGQDFKVSKVQDLYLRDYKAQWQKFLRGLMVPPYKDQKNAEQVLRELSASDSPLIQAMTAVAEQTRLANPVSRGFFSRIFASASGGIDKTRLAEVDRDFAPLARFVEGGDKAPAAKYLEELRTLQQKLGRIELQNKAAAAADAGSDPAGLKGAEQKVEQLVEGFKTEPTKDAADVLKQPLARVRELIDYLVSGDNVTAWARLAERLRKLESLYPFAASDSSFAPANDLTALLNPVNGALADFTNKRLASFIDNAQGEWRRRKPDDQNVSLAVIDYLNRVEKLREALFPNRSAELRVEYDLTILNDANGPPITIQASGAQVDSVNNKTAHGSWPSRQGAAGASITVARPDGANATREFPGGSWGLFKMFEQGNPRRVGNQYQLSWAVGGVTVRANFAPASTTHPFERSLFTQIHVPPNLK